MRIKQGEDSAPPTSAQVHLCSPHHLPPAATRLRCEEPLCAALRWTQRCQQKTKARELWGRQRGLGALDPPSCLLGQSTLAESLLPSQAPARLWVPRV